MFKIRATAYICLMTAYICLVYKRSKTTVNFICNYNLPMEERQGDWMGMPLQRTQV